jgi:hypothetical protein
VLSRVGYVNEPILTEEEKLHNSVFYRNKLYHIEISCGPYIVIPYRGIVCKYIL